MVQRDRQDEALGVIRRLLSGEERFDYQSEWFQVDMLGGTAQQVSLDLNVFQAANKNAIVGFVFAGFTDNTRAWTLRDLKFTCGALLKRSIGGSPEPPCVAPANPLRDFKA